MALRHQCTSILHLMFEVSQSDFIIMLQSKRQSHWSKHYLQRSSTDSVTSLTFNPYEEKHLIFVEVAQPCLYLGHKIPQCDLVPICDLN
jgi:hypothetical protein